MEAYVFASFRDEIVKQGGLTPTLRAGAQKLMQRPSAMAPKMPSIPKPGKFGIMTKTNAAEKMDAAAWRQTAMDVPIVIGATGVGFALGKTVGEEAGRHFARRAIRTGGKVPGWTKHLPMAASMASSIGAYALGRSRAKMQERRQAASRSKKAGVGPAPQSQGIPKKKPSDPWRYDSRPAGGL